MMIAMVALLLALALCGEVTEAQIEAYAQRSQLERKQQIAAAEKQILATKRDRHLSRTQKHAKTKKIEKRIEMLGSTKEPFYPAMRSRLVTPRLGDIGLLNRRARVVQVLDKHSALVEAYDTVTGAYSGREMFIDVTLLWYEGLDTTGLVDGSKISLDRVYAITGTKTYDTEDGTNTIFVLEAVDVATIKDKFIAPAVP